MYTEIHVFRCLTPNSHTLPASKVQPSIHRSPAMSFLANFGTSDLHRVVKELEQMTIVH